MTKKTKRQQRLQNQVRRLNKRVHYLNALSGRLSWYRIWVFFGGMAIGVGAYYLIDHWLGWGLIGLTLLVFNIVAYYHRRLERSISKHQIWLDMKTTQVARMNLDWQKLPPSAVSPVEPDHPFGTDLDITGEKSLHRLIDSSVSRNGSERLRQWLLETQPRAETIRRRQRLLAELRPLTGFRDRLFLAYSLTSKEALQSQTLLRFLEQPAAVGPLKRVLGASLALSAVSLTLFALYLLNLLPPFWILSLTVYGMLYFMNHRHTEDLLDESVLLTEELKKFRALARYLESYHYGHRKQLAELCQPFLDAKNRPSKQLRRITLLATGVGLRMNPLVRLILNVLMPYDFLCAHFLNKQKQALTAHLPLWLDTLFELETMLSLANFAYLNPHYSLPEIVTGENQRFVFKAKQLGHPLLPEAQKKCNDFAFNSRGEVALITGSNMSGKSTFLKTIGVNLCLAFAGAPVNAEHLQTSLFRVFTSIKINDSLTDGFSFFYAEVRRLKALLDGLEKETETPVLFLIDEIFKGTNNRERYLGGRAYIEALVDKNGLGAVATHDLELTKLADKIPSVINYHFKEHVEAGQMVFDYKLRPGPCPTTNALEIMRLQGLPVGEGTEV